MVDFSLPTLHLCAFFDAKPSAAQQKTSFRGAFFTNHLCFSDAYVVFLFLQLCFLFILKLMESINWICVLNNYLSMPDFQSH